MYISKHTQNYHILPEGNKTHALLLPRSPALLEAQGHLIPEVIRRCKWERTRQHRRSKKCRFHPWDGKIPWRRAWQPTVVFLPGQRSLAGYSPWVAKSWTRLKRLSTYHSTSVNILLGLLPKYVSNPFPFLYPYGHHCALGHQMANTCKYFLIFWKHS